MSTRKVKFVQLAVARDEGDEGLYALGADGNVYSHYEHAEQGWGWYRVAGDKNRRREDQR